MAIVATTITLVFVAAVITWVAYALIRPFTHVHHDHNDVFHPKLD
jgi:hypothetical protein